MEIDYNYIEKSFISFLKERLGLFHSKCVFFSQGLINKKLEFQILNIMGNYSSDDCLNSKTFLYVVSETIMLDLKNNHENQQIKNLERRLNLPPTDNDSININNIRIIREYDLLIYIYINSVKGAASEFKRNNIGTRVSSLLHIPKELEEWNPKENELRAFLVRLYFYNRYKLDVQAS